MNVMKMKLGLFRLWAVLTALWIVFVVLLNFGDVAREFQQAADGGAVFPPHPWWMVGSIATVTLAFPLVILIIGGGIYWIIEGFSTSQKSGDC